MSDVIGAKMASSGNSKRLVKGFLDAWEYIFATPVELIAKHFEKRIAELFMAVAQSGEGILLVFSPASLQSSSFHFVVNSLNVGTCIVIFLGAGITRIIALVLNGHWMPYGAYVRVGCCIAGAFMWLMMAFGLYVFNEGKSTSPGIPLYIPLAMLEIVSIYRAIHGLKRWRLYGQSN